MDININVSTDPLGFTRCVVPGGASLQEAIQILESFPGLRERLGRNRLLIDLRSVIREFPFGERFDLGVAIAKSLSRFERVAIVHVSTVDGGFTALVARNRGVNVSAFDTPEAAAAWLTQRPVDRSSF